MQMIYVYYVKVEVNYVINIIDKWSTLNKIKVNKLKSGIMILKNNDNANENNIEEYLIINEYKYLGILINDKMNIQKHITYPYKIKMGFGNQCHGQHMSYGICMALENIHNSNKFQLLY